MRARKYAREEVSYSGYRVRLLHRRAVLDVKRVQKKPADGDHNYSASHEASVRFEKVWEEVDYRDAPTLQMI